MTAHESTPPCPPALTASIAAAREQLVRQVLRMMRNPDDAEDVAHDALAAALANIHRYRGDAKLATWLYRVGANAALMALRRERRAVARTARALVMLPPESNWLHGAGGSESAPQQLEQAHREHLLRWAVSELPAHYRTVITACDLDECAIPTVAAVHGLTTAGVRTRRLRALRLLRARLADSEALGPGPGPGPGPGDGAPASAGRKRREPRAGTSAQPAPAR